MYAEINRYKKTNLYRHYSLKCSAMVMFPDDGEYNQNIVNNLEIIITIFLLSLFLNVGIVLERFHYRICIYNKLFLRVS